MISRKDFTYPDLDFKVTKENVKDFYCADVKSGRSFLLNDGGYPLNDIDMIMRQQDAKVRDSLIAQLQEIPTSGVSFETPNNEVLMSLKSRYQQTPSELVAFYERQLELRELDAQQNVDSSETIKFEGSENSEN